MSTIRTPKNIFESDHIIRYSSPQGSSSKEKTSKCYVLTLYSAAEKARGSDLRCLLLHSKLPVKLTLHLAEVQRHAKRWGAQGLPRVLVGDVEYIHLSLSLLTYGVYKMKDVNTTVQLDKKLYWFPWFKLCSLHLATSVIGLTPFIMFWYDCKLILQWLITEENVSPGFWEDWCNYCTVRLIVIMHRNITVSLLLLLITMGTLISDVLCDNRTQRFKRRVIFIKGSKFFVSVNNYFKNVVHFYVCVILKIKRKDFAY